MKDYYEDYRKQKQKREMENETMHEYLVWDYDEGNHSWSTMATFKYPDSMHRFQNNTR